MSTRQLDRRARADTSSVAWRPRGELGFEDWVDTIRRLGSVARACPWWLGDALNYGAAAYGEKYEAAVEVTGLDIGTLMNYSYVSGAFAEISRRHETLSWSHHYEVAGLAEEEQNQWLDRAEKDGWSRRRLRNALKADRESSTPMRHLDPQREELVLRLTHAGGDLEPAEAIERLCARAEELGFAVLARP